MPSAIAWHLDAGERIAIEPPKSLRKPDHRGRADLHVQVRTFPVDELFEPGVELRHDGRAVRRRRGQLLHTLFLRRCSRDDAGPTAVARVCSLCIGRDGARLQSEYAVRHGRYVRRSRRLSRAPPRDGRPRNDRRGARTCPGASAGRELASMPSRSPRCSWHTRSRCSSRRSRKGQSRSVMSTLSRPRRRNRGSNPASESASCSTARFGPLEVRPPGFGAARPTRYAPHSRADATARDPLSGTRDVPGHDLREQAVVSTLAFLTIDDGVDRLGSAHRGDAPLRLTRDQAGFLQAPQVRAQGVDVQPEADRKLPHRDRAARQTQVAVQPVPRVVGQRLVDLDRRRLGHSNPPRVSWISTANTV